MQLPVVARLAAVALSLGLAFASNAAPFTPTSDSDVVERLPLASDPSARRIDSLRKQLAARPGDAALRTEIARRYFDLAMAQGDPRLVGYASAALAPIATAATDNAAYWLVQGLLQQYSHGFEAALVSLAKASQLDPRAAEPLSWRAAILMVQARYPEALAECEKLAPLAAPLFSTGCISYARAASGQLETAYRDLSTAVGSAPDAAPELRLWLYTRLAEMAGRLQRHAVAESWFKKAFDVGVTDQFLLAAYADFLLQQKRPAEVLPLLANWERSDVLLLRLALAGQAASDARAAGWATQLRERFQAAAQRGDSLHEQEAARFEVDIERNPGKALPLAVHNYTVQKEPRDAEMLMRAALAAGQAKAAQPALDWLRSSRYEDPVLAALATQLAARGARQ